MMLSDEDHYFCDQHSYGNTQNAKLRAYGNKIQTLTREHLLKDISAYLAENLMSPKDYSEAILLKFGV